jgi:hypothetical protein
VDANAGVAVQAAFAPHMVARLGRPRLLGLAIDWTMFDATLPSGKRVRYQVLRVAALGKGWALPSGGSCFASQHCQADSSATYASSKLSISVRPS